MFLDAKDIQFFYFFVPVSANATEAAGAVIQRVGRDADLGIFQRDEFILEVRPLAQDDCSLCALAAPLGAANLRFKSLNHCKPSFGRG
jgi:hypothetical protein